MQKYFEVMLKIFKISREYEIRDIDWSMQISFHQSSNRISRLKNLSTKDLAAIVLEFTSHTQYVALLGFKASFEKLLLIDFVNIYLFSVFFSIDFANIYLFSMLFSIDFACWKSVVPPLISYIGIH